MSFPSVLNYGSNKPMSYDATPQILRFSSANQTYREASTVQIVIPTGRRGEHIYPLNSYMEGTLSVTVKGTTTASECQIDQSIYSIFKRMRILHGGQVLEDQMYPNRLWTAIRDLQKNSVERYGESINLLSSSNGFDGQAFAVANNTNNQIFNLPFAFTIPSAVVGSLAQKALPVSIMGSASLIIELELENLNIPFVGDLNFGSVVSWELSDIYYNAKCSSLPSDVESAVLALSNGSIILPAYTYKGEMKTMNTGALNFNDKFSFQYTSVKNYFWFFQNQTTCINATGKHRAISYRPMCDLSSWGLQLNGVPYPSQQIDSTPKFYMELLRAFDSLSDTNAGGVCDYNNYINGTGVATEAIIDNLDPVNDYYRFLTGVDMDKFNHSSSGLMSGSNILGQSLNMLCTLKTALPDNQNVFGFCMIDILYVLENGLLKPKF